jgi:coenzyme PQQ precursor peptide PqqA
VAVAVRTAGDLGTELTGMRPRPSLRCRLIYLRRIAMKWNTPVIIEIAVGMEINAYACAEVE